MKISWNVGWLLLWDTRPAAFWREKYVKFCKYITYSALISNLYVQHFTIKFMGCEEKLCWIKMFSTNGWGWFDVRLGNIGSLIRVHWSFVWLCWVSFYCIEVLGNFCLFGVSLWVWQGVWIRTQCYQMELRWRFEIWVKYFKNGKKWFYGFYFAYSFKAF